MTNKTIDLVIVTTGSVISTIDGRKRYCLYINQIPLVYTASEEEINKIYENVVEKIKVKPIPISAIEGYITLLSYLKP